MAASVRKATLDDVAALAELYRGLASFHASRVPDRLKQPPPDRAPLLSSVRERLGDQSWGVFVADDNGQLIGIADVCVAAEVETRMNQARRFARIANLFVSEGRRGEGLGKRLLEVVETWARGKDLAEVELEVWEFASAALDLYDSSGYQTIERRLSKKFERQS